jgi:predicted restriction endonuclease
MNESNKENIISGSLLFFLLRDSLPYLEEYSFEEFSRDISSLMESVKDWLEKTSIEEVIAEKEALESKDAAIFILNPLASKFKDIIRKEYPQLFKSHISKKLRDEILNRDNFRCQYCGADLKELEENGFPAQVDHIKPKRSGGGDNPENLIAACLKCNLGKRDFDLFEYEDDIHEQD